MDKEKIIEIWNKTSDSDWYKGYRTDSVIIKIIQNPKSTFHHTIWEMLSKNMPSFKNKKICIPSSGDNHAAFAFSILGAHVTSCDISPRQLENAKIIAEKHHFDIEFICSDTVYLSNLPDGTFDLVFTSNGTHVWIDDLRTMYKNISRVLKNDGMYLMYEIHPFNRPFNDGDPANKKSIGIAKPYDGIGPFGVNYHWRLQDILNAVISSSMNITHIEEMFAEYGTYWFESSGERKDMTEKELRDLYDWQTNPLAALPQWLGVSARK